MKSRYFGIPTIKILKLDANSRRRVNYAIGKYYTDIYRIDPGIYQSHIWPDAHALARRLMVIAAHTFEYNVLGCHWDYLKTDAAASW